MIDFIGYGEFHFLRYFCFVGNAAEFEWERHPNMFIIVDFLDVIGRFSEMNSFYFIQIGLCEGKTW